MEITHNPTEVKDALIALPMMNQLIREGHITIVDEQLVIADHVCDDRRFEWLVPFCRVRSYSKDKTQ